ncbi:MAG TPA: cytochrome P450 [Ktedonobacteraceae bacterium]|nr:cytochrome P450 [Ktedonobacteraceae bacterium]
MMSNRLIPAKDVPFSAALRLPENRSDPSRLFAALRSTDPIHYDETACCWVLTRYQDVMNVLHHASFVSSWPPAGWGAEERASRTALHSMLRRQMLFVDGQEHQRLRRLLLKPLASKSRSMHGFVEQVVDALLARVQPQGQMDMVNEFAARLPLRVMIHLLGLPQEDEAQLRVWADSLAHVSSGYLAGEGVQQVMHMLGYFQQLVACKQACPGDDLISTLLEAMDHGNMHSADEVAITSMMLLAAGSVTTAKLLAHGLFALLEDRDRFPLLRATIQTPGLIKLAVEEVLRFVTPTRFVARFAVQDVVIGGTYIRAGQKVLLVLEAANHDPQRFPAPETLDLRRLPNPHLAFGAGRHVCPGAALARVEAQVAFKALLQRFPHLHRAPGTVPEWHPNINLGGFTSLPIVID